MSTLIQDVRYGIRMLVRTPVVSAVAVLSLGLGIAAATAMVALANGFLLGVLPFGDPSSLVVIQQLRDGDSRDFMAGVSVPNFRDLEVAAQPQFAGMAVYTTDDMNVTGLDQPERIQVVTSTPNLFSVVAVDAALGRVFRPEEGAAGGVLILSHDFWTARFQADRSVLGRRIELDGQTHTVIGVMPPGFEMLPANVQAFRASDFADERDRNFRSTIVLGRLRPGVSVENGRAALTAAFTRLEAEYPEANRGWNVLVLPVGDWFPGPTDMKLVLLLVAVALFGVGIACANVANLLLARAETRQREIALRTALGAGRSRVLRQLLTESALLALLAAGLGTVASLYVIRIIRAGLPPTFPQSFHPSLDAPTLVATLVLAMLAGILFGLAPALHAVRGNLRESLGEGARGGTAGRRRRRLRSVFVTAEIAVALALLTGAGFLMKAMDVIVNGDPGFNGEGLLTFQVTLPGHSYPDDAALVAFQRDAQRTLAAVPGVEGVAVMRSLPRGFFQSRFRFHVVGTDPIPENERPNTGLQSVNPDFFATFDIPLIAGRGIQESDRADAPPVAVVSRRFADMWLGGRDGIGRAVEVLGREFTVVGIAGDILQSRIPLGAQAEIAVYVPVEQAPIRNAAWVIRTASDPASFGAAVREAIRTVDSDVPIAQLQTFDEHVRQSLAAPQTLGQFVLALGILAMVLAAIGIYGVMAHNAVLARREIGIRMAIGARPPQVIGMITRRGLLLTGIGLLAGLPIALVVYRAVGSSLSLFEVALEADYAIVGAVTLIAVAVFASILPALRAATVSPVRALQDE